MSSTARTSGCEAFNGSAEIGVSAEGRWLVHLVQCAGHDYFGGRGRRSIRESSSVRADNSRRVFIIEKKYEMDGMAVPTQLPLRIKP